MRIFLANFASDEIINKVIKWQLENENLKVNWVVPENLHITLLPPWEEERENVEENIKILENIKGRIEPFLLNFDEICLGPNFKNPRLIWITGKESDSLFNTKKLLAEKFNQGFLDRNPKKPHLTIARYNNRYVQIDGFKEKIKWQMTFDSVSLIESDLRKDRAYYRVLHEIRF